MRGQFFRQENYSVLLAYVIYPQCRFMNTVCSLHVYFELKRGFASLGRTVCAEHKQEAQCTLLAQAASFVFLFVLIL